jgi:hypothetical protein
MEVRRTRPLTRGGSDTDSDFRSISVVKDRRSRITRPFDVLYHVLDRAGSTLFARERAAGRSGDCDRACLLRDSLVL